MLLIPAIDIKDGQCVRLSQGRMDEATVYADDPVAMAARWVEEGARRLHVVDLNGAMEGKPVHAELIHTIIAQHPDIPVQVGGGVRDESVIESYLEAGARYVIIGTRAVTSPQFVVTACAEFPGHIMVGLDVRDGVLATDGWCKSSQQRATDVARQFEEDGVEAIIFTDINRDGMLAEVNVAAVREFSESVAIVVIASGGLSSLDDVRALCGLTQSGLVGAVAGRALYDGSLNFGEAQALADQLCPSRTVG